MDPDRARPLHHRDHRALVARLRAPDGAVQVSHLLRTSESEGLEAIAALESGEESIHHRVVLPRDVRNRRPRGLKHEVVVADSAVTSPGVTKRTEQLRRLRQVAFDALARSAVLGGQTTERDGRALEDVRSVGFSTNAAPRL